MYKLKESGIGKMWCGDEIIILSQDLSQRKLKKLFNKNCEFVEYYAKEKTTSEETETSSSTAKNEDTSTSSINRRKSNKRKTNKKRKAD